MFLFADVPLHCQLLDELDDVDCSFKCAHLSKYLQDTIEPFHPSSDVDSNSNVSLISTISSVSSVLSLDSDDKAPSQHSLSYSFSDIEEMYFVTTQAKIDKLCREITTQGFFARTLPSRRHHNSISLTIGAPETLISIGGKSVLTLTPLMASSTSSVPIKSSTTIPTPPRLKPSCDPAPGDLVGPG